ncbi:MAG: hypothetical protein VW397_07045 [Candidatus Margulisiibacteriota bacterium]
MTGHTQHVIHNPHITYFYGFSGVSSDEIKNHQFENWVNQYKNLRNHIYINQTENRAIDHHQLRAPAVQKSTIETIQNLDKLIPNHILNVCHIGIGGSINGPKLISHALQTWKTKQKRAPIFISNHDEDHIFQKLNGIDLSKTLFIIVSKSGSTIEVKKILNTIIKNQSLSKAEFLKQQCITITTKGSKIDTPDYMTTFHIDETIGGRFSTTSYVGLITLGLCYQITEIQDLLDGAHQGDENATLTNINNIALNQAIIRYIQQKKYQGLAIVPYGESLFELSPYLTQLICESLGKGATVNESLSQIQHAPILMHGTGPDAQHTFFQQIHQGTPVIPVEFFITKPESENQHHILQQVIGQSIALQEGQESPNPNHYFSGNRPSTLTLLKQRRAESLGFLIAMIENRIMFEGFLQNINAFDQPGVELGKKITKAHTQSDSFGHMLFNELVNESSLFL